MSVSLVSNRISPPSCSMPSTMFVTTVGRMSDPMCGLASQRISRGAPEVTSVCKIRRCSWFLVPVVSFPSENVPAPPSPNWILLSGSSAAVVLKRSMSAVRRQASWPRSMRSGCRPALARASAAKRPAQPAPTTTGRSEGRRASATGAGKLGSPPSMIRIWRCVSASRLLTSWFSSIWQASSTRALRIKCTLLFLRASTDLR